MTNVANSIIELIGNTPIVKLNNLVGKGCADIYLKLEYLNPGGSVKDRIALAMIEEAEKKGILKKGDIIIEPTSGNVGIGLAWVAVAKGYKVIIVMPEIMSSERKNLLKAYGAEVILSPGSEGMAGAIRIAEKIANENGYFIPQQFKNTANPEIHRKTTGKEIVNQFGGRRLDAFISGIGSGGTITGTGKVLRDVYPNIKIIAVEPASSPILSGGSPGAHEIQGLGAGFIPEILDKNIYDEIFAIKNEEAIQFARRVASEEGILVGISGGAAVAAAIKVSSQLGRGKKVLAVIPDNGERYLSTPLFSFE